MQFEVSIPLDDDGYFDRQCPFDACEKEFKIHGEDWKEKVSDELVFCPWCRHEAPSDQWFTPAQLEYLHGVAEQHALNYLVGEMQRTADDFNRSQQRNSWISMRLDVQAPDDARLVPCEAAKIMEQRFECSGCGCRFASVGASFFCPACGLDSAPTAFRSTIETVRRSVTTGIDVLHQTLDREAAADLTRIVIENALVRLVAAHQRHAAALFDKQVGSTVKTAKNLFQRLTEASDMWKSHTGVGYSDLITPDELRQLLTFFQKRHLLEHRDGVVDAEYVRKTGDGTWQPGQRLVITAQDVIGLADLLLKLGEGIERTTAPRVEPSAGEQ